MSDSNPSERPDVKADDTATADTHESPAGDPEIADGETTPGSDPDKHVKGHPPGPCSDEHKTILEQYSRHVSQFRAWVIAYGAGIIYLTVTAKGAFASEHLQGSRKSIIVLCWFAMAIQVLLAFVTKWTNYGSFRAHTGHGLMIAALLVAVVSITGCQTAVDTVTGTSNANVGQSMAQPQGTLTRKELSQKLRRLAMSYLGEIPEACEAIAATDASLEQRLLALQIRVNSSDSVISIAADADPQVSLLNMVTVLTLQRMLAEERATEFFGEPGQYFIDSTRRMEEEGWKLATQVMDEKERQELLDLITQYRKDHIEDTYVWWTRFSEFSSYREQFSVAGTGQQIVDLFVPVGSAVSGIESTTDVAERATWLASRQALIIQWRVELMYLQTLAAPETARVLDDVKKVSNTIAGLPEQVAAEREAIFAAIEDQQGELRRTIGEVQGTIDQARATIGDVNATIDQAQGVIADVDGVVGNVRGAITDVQATIDQGLEAMGKAEQILPSTEVTLAQLERTSESLNTTLQTVGAIAKEFETPEEERDPNAPPARPFDITEYTAALQQAGTTLQELNTVLASVDQTADPNRLDATLDTLEDRFSALIWQAGFMVVAIGLILILAANLIPGRKRGAAG